MEIGKKVCTFLRGTFAVGFLSAAALFSPAKADAALSVTNIDYDKSEMTIKSDAKDTTLYFSNSSAKKWDTCVGEFGEDGTYVMDISWISVTKNYPITFKGDVSTDVLKVTLPKQVPNFKVKYDKVNTRFNYTNDGGREIEYRKNNTSAWEEIPSSDQSNQLQELIQRLTENGATLYFRLKGENGTSDSAVGKRPSKEVSCKIAKKANAPSVSLNTSNNTIAVQAGWQVRQVDVRTKSDVQYVTGWKKASESYTDATNENGFWHTYTAKGNIPLTEIAKDMMLDNTSDAKTEGSNEDYIYLQFRKKATSSAQVSRMTTIKIPKQETTPEPGITLELTSLTTYKVTFTNASISQPFEYCVVPEEDITGTGDTAKISNLQDVTWKTSNSGVGIELKQKDAPEGSRIFYRRKAIGSLGSDDFKLATNYKVYSNAGLTYPTSSTQDVLLNTTDGKMTVSKIDGQCVQSDTSHYITFSITTEYNQAIDKIYLSNLPGNKMSAPCVPVFTSTVKSAGKDSAGKNKYIINATIKEISLPQDYKQIVEDQGEITLYAYITLKTPSGSSDAPCIISTETSGLIITINKKSSIETDLSQTDDSNQINVKRWVGYPTTGDGNTPSGENYQFADFWFKINGSKEVKDIKFGNTTLQSGTDYTVERITETSSGSSKDQKVTIHLSQCEKNLSSYYGKQTSLVVILGNSTDGTEEKLSGVTVTLLSPVSLNSNYSWTFKKGKLITEKTTTTTANGVTTTTTEPVNDYSASYTKNNSNTINGVAISNISLIGGTVEDANAKKPVKDSDGKITGEESACEADTKNVNITLSGDNGKIVFSNEALNWLSSGSRPVTLTFTVRYSNSVETEFVIDKDCIFYVL